MSENIRARAEQLWRELGCPNDRDEEIWLMAEDAIGAENSSKVKSLKVAAPKMTKPRVAAPKAKKAVTKK